MRKRLKYPRPEDVAAINAKIVAHTDPRKSKILPTRFLDLLARLHEGSDMRYGQIMNNALQLKYGRNRHPGTGACFDTFYVTDEEFTAILEEYMKAAKGKEFKGP